MRVHVRFRSGLRHDFVVDPDILYDDFVRIAFELGGQISLIRAG